MFSNLDGQIFLGRAVLQPSHICLVCTCNSFQSSVKADLESSLFSTLSIPSSNCLEQAALVILSFAQDNFTIIRNNFGMNFYWMTAFSMQKSHYGSPLWFWLALHNQGWNLAFRENAELVFNALTEKLRNIPAALKKRNTGTGSFPA